MKRLVILLLAMMSVASAPAGERSLKDWLKDLDARLRRVDDRRKGKLVAAASVRGDKADAGKIYWKGRRSNGAVTAEELDAFKAAVDLAREEGKSAEAKTALEGFVAKYPGGALEGDAKETLALLPPPEPAPAAPSTEEK